MAKLKPISDPDPVQKLAPVLSEPELEPVPEPMPALVRDVVREGDSVRYWFENFRQELLSVPATVARVWGDGAVDLDVRSSHGSTYYRARVLETREPTKGCYTAGA